MESQGLREFKTAKRDAIRGRVKLTKTGGASEQRSSKPLQQKDLQHIHHACE